MIIGSGNIAKALNDREGAVFFASGVSNSRCTDVTEFIREIDLMDGLVTDKCVFYFSTISKYYTESAYTLHKGFMEMLCKIKFKNYNIIRIGNIDFDTNPNTFVNALRAKKAKGEPYELFDEYRYMISKEELLLLTDNLPLTGKNEINVFGRMVKPKDLI